MALSIDVVKIIVLLSLFTLTLICGIIPVLLLRLVNRTRSGSENFPTSATPAASTTPFLSYKKYLSFLSCFAAGVFLATCLLDLLPDVRHNLIRVLFSVKVYTGFPVAEFVMVIGLFLILIIEQIVLTIKETQASPHHHGSDSETISDATQPLLPQTEPDSRDEMTESFHSEHSLGGISDEPHRGSFISRAQGGSQRNLYTYEDDELTVQRNSDDLNHSFARQVSYHSQIPQQTHSPLRAMLLVCALALHSIFEGLTVGLLTSVPDVVGVFAALAVHKSILSFSLGMNLIQSRISIKSAVRSVIAFSLASPLGIAIGIGITDLWTSVTSGLVRGILQGIASGTFLYIIFFEILPKEFNNDTSRLLKVLFLIIGYATVTGILFLSDDIKHPFCVINDKL